jgi:conjugative relaxase-like TrwC/TraI family protein
VLTIRAMSEGTGYASRHLEHRDYYAEGERVVGHWQGRGAERIGLLGEVRSADFEALREGHDPKTGEFLRQRQSADRVDSDGTNRSRGRNLYDFTFSAPKSVSIMAILGGDDRLIEAHQTAVAEALQEMETHAATRVRRAGANENRTTGNMVLAVYHHDTSRELDPQLHTHAVAANLSYDSTEGRWKALQASGIYERRAYLTEVYRNALARQVLALGYEIENRRDKKGRDSGFEIRGVSDDLLIKFSQRSRQRDDAIEEFIRRNGRQPTDNEIAVLIRETRADKLVEISTAEVRTQQQKRLTPVERQIIIGLRSPKHDRPLRSDSAEPSLNYAKEHVFERVSVAGDHDLLTEALRHGRGRIDHHELRGCIASQESSGAILREENQIATTDSLIREREMIELINRGIDRFSRLGGTKTFRPSRTLRPEQGDAIQFVLDSKARAVNVQGAAGTGKTATLRELERALRQAGHGVMAVAPTMSAVEELHKVGFTDALTLERLLQDKRSQTKLHGQVLFVDEAGMVSGRQMWELLRLAEKQSARIIFCGDTKQIQSVEACDALRVLEQESQLPSVRLTKVERQKVSAYREAVQELRANPNRGFERLEAMGAVREVAWTDRARAVAVAYAESKSPKTLVVCATHDEIDHVTEAIRSDRKRTGELAEGVLITRHRSLNWTAAQKKNMRHFRPGQLLGFHREVKGIQKNETVEVVEVASDRLTVRNERGEHRTLTGKQAKAFDVLERIPIEVAAGDQLLLTANRREPGFRATNGELVTVSHVDGGERLHLNDGRVLPSNFRQFSHGYAVTAHRSQGKSVDSVIISGDGMQKELFYVAASRGRERVLVITSDKERLRETVAQSTARKSASELVRKQQNGLHQGMNRVPRRPHFLQPFKPHNQPPERLEKTDCAAQHEPSFGTVNMGERAAKPSPRQALPADRMIVLDDDRGVRHQPAAKIPDNSFLAAEAMTKKLLGEQARTLTPHIDSGIYLGEIIGETDMHVLQRLTPRMVIAHVKDVLNCIPEIGSEVSIVYSRCTATVRQIPAREREKELSR